MDKFLDIFSKSKNNSQERPKIVIDNREKNSLVLSELIALGVDIELKQLSIGDYLIGKTAIERKTISDLKSSIVNKRIFSQLSEISQYPERFLIIEGIEKEDIYSGGIHENALRGFIISSIKEYKIPIIFTLNEKDTAKYLFLLARRNKKNQTSIRASKIRLSEKEQLQFILEGFPEIGPVSAKNLLSHFKNLKFLMTASEEELKKVIGKKAKNFHNLINLED